MSLHDRIMRMTAPDNVAQHPLCMGGFSVAQQDAAKLATEADDLMEEMAEALEQAVTSMQDSGYRNDSVVIMATKQALITYKERNNEQ